MHIVERIGRVDPFSFSLGLTIGNFDGFHQGHKKIIEELVSETRKRNLYSAVITFKDHPLKLINNGAPPQLMSRMEKIEGFEKLGVDLLYHVDFDETMCGMKPLRFLTLLGETLGPKLYCLGHGFRFGSNNEGDVTLIERYGSDLGYGLIEVDDVQLDGSLVSSTRIREAVRCGNIETANRLLGRPYAVWLERRKPDVKRLDPFLPHTAFPPDGAYEGELLAVGTGERSRRLVTVSKDSLTADAGYRGTGTLFRFFFITGRAEKGF
ncbi:MAG: FAD synthetase family protein [Spirochaetes bacterium]|nr:FAD synthetase family protein [Spirochaetota bacterium]